MGKIIDKIMKRMKSEKHSNDEMLIPLIEQYPGFVETEPYLVITRDVEICLYKIQNNILDLIYRYRSQPAIPVDDVKWDNGGVTFRIRTGRNVEVLNDQNLKWYNFDYVNGISEIEPKIVPEFKIFDTGVHGNGPKYTQSQFDCPHAALARLETLVQRLTRGDS